MFPLDEFFLYFLKLPARKSYGPFQFPLVRFNAAFKHVSVKYVRNGQSLERQEKMSGNLIARLMFYWLYPSPNTDQLHLAAGLRWQGMKSQ